MTRILFCGDVPFPRGVAGSNFSLCTAKLFREAGYDVIYIGLDSAVEDVTDPDSGLFIYEGIKYTTVAGGSGYKGTLNVKLLSGRNAVKKLRELGACRDDIIVTYGTNSAYLRPVLGFAKKRNIKTVSMSCEWHLPMQYRLGKMDIRYISSNTSFEKLIPGSKNVIVVSKLIESRYREKNCHILRMPMLLDEESSKDDFVDRKLQKGERRNIVYAGDPGRKDDLCTVLKGISLLDKEEREKMKFHWVGLGKEASKAKMGQDGYLLDELSDCVETYDRMDLKELMTFYKDMDFLALARNDNRISNAGFPSKVPEAMLQGIIPVINRVGDVPSYLHDGEDAFIFEKNDAESFLTALKRIIGATEEDIYKMRCAACENARKSFEYHQWIDTMTEFMKNLI